MNRRSQLDEAATHVRKGRFAKAIDVYRSVLSMDPDNADVRADLADAYSRSGNADRAFHHFHKAAVLYQTQGDVESSLEMLQHADQISSKEPDILFRIGECLKLLGRVDEMRGPLLRLVRVARAAGDRRRLWALQELTTLYPDDVLLAEELAEVWAETGQVDNAVHLFQKVAICYESDSPDFDRIVQKAAKAATNRTELGVELAKFVLAQGRPREALAVLVPYYEEEPGHISVLETLLSALSAIGATEKIIPARIELIKARAKLNQRPQGLHDVQELLQVAPSNVGALEVCAHAYGVFGEVDKAKSAWRRLIRVADESGQRLERDRAVLALLKLDSDDLDALETGARALREAGRAKEAEALEARLADVRARSRAASGQPPSRAPSLAAPPVPTLERPPQEQRPAPSPVPKPAPSKPRLQAIARIGTPSREPSTADLRPKPQAPSAHLDSPFEEQTALDDDHHTVLLDELDVLEVQSDVHEATRATLEGIPAFSPDEEATVGVDQMGQAGVASERAVEQINARLRKITNTRLASTDEVERLIKLAGAGAEDADLLVDEETLAPPEDAFASASVSPRPPMREEYPRGNSQATYYGAFQDQIEETDLGDAFDVDLEVDVEEDEEDGPVPSSRYTADEVTSKVAAMVHSEEERLGTDARPAVRFTDVPPPSERLDLREITEQNSASPLVADLLDDELGPEGHAKPT